MKWGSSKEGYDIRRIPLSSDQRRYQRIKMILGIVCHRDGNPNINIFTDDVSAGGIKFSSQQQLNRDEEIVIELPIGLGKYRKVKGRIAWFRKGLINTYEGGLEFYDMDEDVERAWERFIERNVVKK